MYWKVLKSAREIDARSMLIFVSFLAASSPAPSAEAAAALERGLVAARAGDQQEALEALEAASGLAPDWATPVLKMANVLSHLAGDMQGAEEAYARALALAPASQQAHYFLGQAKAKAGRHEEAAASLARALVLDVGAADGREIAGILESDLLEACLNAGVPREDAAIRVALSMCEGKPTFDGRYGLGKALEERGRTAEATSQYAEATRLGPARAEAHGKLAQSLQAQERLGEAVESYATAATLRPSDTVAYFNMGVATRRLGDAPAAAAHFEAAGGLASGGFAQDAFFSAGAAHRLAGDVDAAARCYGRAIAADPGGPGAWKPNYNLGNLLRDEKREAEATGRYERAVGLNPRAADAYQQLRRLSGVPNTVTCAEGMPLVVQRAGGMPAAAFAQLRRDVLSHPWAGYANRLSKSFEGTRGFVVRFNSAGYAQSFREHEQLRCLVPFFEAAVLDDANVFVMNVLVVPVAAEGAAGDAAGGGGAEGVRPLAVQRHLDNTLAICTPSRSYVAHQVDVLYVDVPEGMLGGRLCVWEPEAEGGAPLVVPPPAQTVEPSRNLWVSFRGDAKHGVESAAVPAAAGGGGPLRVSLVLEQYKVGADELPLSEPFQILATQG